MDEYVGNSNRSKKESNEQPKKLEKVISGTATVKKKSGMSKFANAFISEDASNVKDYILGDVLIPALKKAVSDIITNGIDMLLYGESGRSNRRDDRADKVSYGKFYNRDRRESATRVRATYDYDDIALPSRGEAERVLDRLDEQIDVYGTASVGDLYDLVGVTGTYTDYKYGWTDLRPAHVERLRDGRYLLKMPRAMPLD